MLLFSTVLSIKESMTKDDFIRLVIEWNQGSPHENNRIPNINWNGERNVKYGADGLWMEIQEYRNENSIAVRYEKIEDDGVVWDSDYVMNFTDRKMAIRLERSYLETALTINAGFSTPHFITLLIDKGYIVDDGNLPVLRTPVLINENNLTLLSDVVNGTSHYQLPVVYVSKTFLNENPVDVGRLSSRLKGVAHVLVQESKSCNQQLRTLCDSQNEYFGAIGIYYPNPVHGHRKYLYREYEGSSKALLEKVVRTVIQYSNAQMIKPLYTWQGVNNALLRDRLSSQRAERSAAEEERRQALYRCITIQTEYEKQREDFRKQAVESAQAEANSLLESFDEEMRQLQERVDALTRQNETLAFENDRLREKLSRTDGVPVLCFGDEDEFFQGEIKEIILSVLDTALRNTPPKSRRYDVLSDILQSNGGYHGSIEEREQTIKRLLRGYKNVNGTLKQALINLGFSITDDGKHYKLVYYGDHRYTTVIAKTPSDNRAGMNDATRIIKNMF